MPAVTDAFMISWQISFDDAVAPSDVRTGPLARSGITVGRYEGSLPVLARSRGARTQYFELKNFVSLPTQD